MKATRYLEAGDDELLTLVMGYVMKLKKLTQQQLIFADKVINATLFDGQIGLLNRRSYVVNPSELPSTTSPSPSLSSHTSNSSSVPKTVKSLFEGFSYKS